MALIDDVRSIVDGHNIVRRTDAGLHGAIRFETAFSYPDGSSIDLFLVESATLESSDFRARKLTDLAATMEWLMDVQIKPWLSPKRKIMMEDALRVYTVDQNDGALELAVPELEQLPGRIVSLGQACLRVADLIYTRRSSLQAPIVQEIEEIMVDVEVPYETNYDIAGPFGKPVRVDILAMASRRSAILTLSSANPSAAHTVSNEILRKWFDLERAESPEQRITVYDDRKDAYRDEDLQRLETLSTVVPLSDRQMIADLVAP